MNFQSGAIVEVIEDSEKDKRDMALNCGRSRVGMIGVVLYTVVCACCVEFEDEDGMKRRCAYHFKKLKTVMHTTIDTEQDDKIADFIGNF